MAFACAANTPIQKDQIERQEHKLSKYRKYASRRCAGGWHHGDYQQPGRWGAGDFVTATVSNYTARTPFVKISGIFPIRKNLHPISAIRGTKSPESGRPSRPQRVFAYLQTSAASYSCAIHACHRGQLSQTALTTNLLSLWSWFHQGSYTGQPWLRIPSRSIVVPN
jgi:hypothetical protein